MLGLLLVVCAFAAGNLKAQDAPVILRVHHVLGPKAPAQARFLEPWAQRIEEQSDGRIQFKIYPAMSLGGRAPELYQQVRDGRVDLVWTVAGYTPDQFPRVEVFELPFVHRNNVIATNLAMNEMFDQYLAPDFADVHPLLVHVHAGQAFQMAERPIRSLDDIAGLRIRAPTRVGLWMLEAWGADPVGVPVPAVPIALEKNVIDGMLLPFEVVPPFRLQNLTSSATLGPEDVRFGTAVFMLVMNKAVYDGLPADLKQVIDNNARGHLSEEVGRIWQEAENVGQGLIEQAGNEIVTLSPQELARFESASEAVTRRWVEEVTHQGIDGANLLREARAAVARHSR